MEKLRVSPRGRHQEASVGLHLYQELSPAKRRRHSDAFCLLQILHCLIALEAHTTPFGMIDVRELLDGGQFQRWVSAVRAPQQIVMADCCFLC